MKIINLIIFSKIKKQKMNFILIKKIKKQLAFLAGFKKTKTHKNLRILSNSKFLKFKSKNIISNIIGLSIYATNIIIFLSNSKGNIIYFCSAGFLRIKKKYRKKKIVVLKKLIIYLITKTKNLSKNLLIGLHLKNISYFIVSMISVFLIKHFIINIIRINNNKPHNGCRPKKIKRKRRKKTLFS